MSKLWKLQCVFVSGPGRRPHHVMLSLEACWTVPVWERGCQRASVYSIVFATQVKSPSFTVYPPLPSSTSPTPLSFWSSPCCCLIYKFLWVFFAESLHLLHSTPQTPSSLTVVSLFYVSMSLLYFLSLFCSFHSIYKWDHMVFAFLRLVCLPWHNNLQVHPCRHKR